MSKATKHFIVEGVVKSVINDTSGARFTLTPTQQFTFEGENGGASSRSLLFVEEATSSHTAQIVDLNREFTTNSLMDFTSLLVMKANQLKVRIAVLKKDLNMGGRVPVRSLTIN